MAYVEGLHQVLRNIDFAMRRVRGATEVGMVAGLKHLENQMLTVSPTVPKKTGELRESWYIIPARNPVSPQVFAGYTAQHAPYVHEKIDAINWTEIGSGPKWLQIHFAREERAMQLIIAQHIRASIL